MTMIMTMIMIMIMIMNMVSYHHRPSSVIFAKLAALKPQDSGCRPPDYDYDQDYE